jgi:hydroxymethylbilane synthase
MSSHPILRIGTRASALARWQADWVAARLVESGVEVETVLITTQGDTRSGSLQTSGTQGLFTKEIQQALLDDRIDIAVHSLKDLPTEKTDGLVLSAVPERESTSDVLVAGGETGLDELPKQARVGTGSLRRQAQLLYARSDLQVLDIRGNVDTRLRKLEEGQYDAIVLAEAGLRRLGLSDHISQVLPNSIMLPAVGQGALGIEARRDDSTTHELLAVLDHPPTHWSVLAERSLLAALRGGCLAPVGAWGRIVGEQLVLDAVVLKTDGTERLGATAAAGPEDAEALGRDVAADLIEQGAEQLIASSRTS